jgi:lipopolysaccharide/colanic/teichoic acid biosynthesis glycosyltransferase
VGRFLRNSSLDELPQLLNVVRGEMALIGPRPCVSYELGDFETLNARYKKRFQVLPGITGLAQVTGRNELPWDEKVNYDNLYIDQLAAKGFLLDLTIMLRTVGKVLHKNSIYESRPDGLDDRQAAEESEQRIIELAHRIEETEKEGAEQYVH